MYTECNELSSNYSIGTQYPAPFRVPFGFASGLGFGFENLNRLGFWRVLFRVRRVFRVGAGVSVLLGAARRNTGGLVLGRLCRARSRASCFRNGSVRVSGAVHVGLGGLGVWLAALPGPAAAVLRKLVEHGLQLLVPQARCHHFR